LFNDNARNNYQGPIQTAIDQELPFFEQDA